MNNGVPCATIQICSPRALLKPSFVMNMDKICKELRDEFNQYNQNKNSKGYGSLSFEASNLKIRKYRL